MKAGGPWRACAAEGEQGRLPSSYHLSMRKWLALLVVTLLAGSCSSRQPPTVASPTAQGANGTESATAPPRWPAITLNKVATGFTQPAYLAGAGDGSGRIFVVEQPGRIRILKSGSILPSPFLDITSLVQLDSEQGLLSVAFSPGFARNGTFYIDYTSKAGNGRTVIARYHVLSTNPDLADASIAETILTIDQPYPNHNGGQLQFGPDGLLYIGMGDGGSAGDPQHNGQNPTALLASILRIDVEHGAGPYQPQIWAKGLRNPWRFSFDAANGDLYIADVGQDSYEEVDYVPAGTGPGLNFGWNVMEGLHCYGAATCSASGFTLPVAEYDHGQGCSVSGGYVYRAKRYPALTGIYFYGDFCSGKLWGMRRVNGAWSTSVLKETDFSVSGFGIDDDGNLYLLDYHGGIYEVAATP